MGREKRALHSVENATTVQDKNVLFVSSTGTGSARKTQSEKWGPAEREMIVSTRKSVLKFN
jgi:hypothetical protein